MTRIHVKSLLSVSSASDAVDSAVAGVGIACLLCYQVWKSLAEKQMVLLLRQCEPEPVPVSLVYPGTRLVPQKLKAFMEFVVPRMKRQLVFDP